MKLCCQNLEYYVKENKEVKYSATTRRYYLRLRDDDNGTLQELYYCPWCGYKLPKDLDSDWFKVLREEYSITDPIFNDADKIPEEFKSDEWWKKRGL